MQLSKPTTFILGLFCGAVIVVLLVSVTTLQQKYLSAFLSNDPVEIDDGEMSSTSSSSNPGEISEVPEEPPKLCGVFKDENGFQCGGECLGGLSCSSMGGFGCTCIPEDDVICGQEGDDQCGGLCFSGEECTPDAFGCDCEESSSSSSSPAPPPPDDISDSSSS